MGKICTKCKKDKELNEFGKKTSSKDGLRNDCKECRKIERKIYLEKNRKPKKEKIKLTEEEKKIKSHERYLKNKDKIKIRNKNWRLNNIEKVRDYKRRYVNQRYHSDPEYRFMWLIRTKINKVLKGTRKYKKTMELVGCTIEELKIYLEKQFKEGMTWENRGIVWHIDHIKPISKFDLTNEEEQKKCFHYTNLQPLFAIDNLRKSNKYQE
ncbi:MAG TPA: hypothetical protein VI911_08860 [Patescibacteria group bacterium]|nr:MAG: hypothetical protein UR43_C0005G0060 [candidate division TM6 bacterium GW2011_GWF2_33_332]HLD91107.1 hypothetical protein [Patescibacteria group bacterium]